MTLIRKKFYFMRHGQTAWNIEGKTAGNEPVPLDKAGQLQAESVQDILASLPLTHIYYSPALRVVQTVETACKKCSCHRSVLDGLKEWDYGDYIGQIKDKYILGHIDTLQPPHGERREDFFARTVQAANEVLESTELPLMVAHLGNYWALCNSVNLPYVYMANCQVMQFTPIHTGWQQEFICWL